MPRKKRPEWEVYVDEWYPGPTNLRTSLETAGPILAEKFRSRARSGIGTNGPLKKPKDGENKPWDRTGRLIDSISSRVESNKVTIKTSSVGDGFSQRWTIEQPVLIVAAEGERDDRKISASRRKSARTRGRQRRAAIVIGAVFSRKPISRATVRRQIKNVGLKAITRNAAIAGILSVPPKDANGVKGGRGIYRIVEFTPRERIETENFIARRLNWAAIPVRSFVRETGIRRKKSNG